MFKIENYKITFEKRWHDFSVINNIDGSLIPKSGRYDMVCEIWVKDLEVPRFTGVAKLHPNDRPDKIVGKKIALQNAIGLIKVKDQPFLHFSTLQQQDAFCKKEVRSAIWKAFWAWVESWKAKKRKLTLLEACLTVQRYNKAALENRIDPDDCNDYWESTMSIVDKAVQQYEKEN